MTCLLCKKDQPENLFHSFEVKTENKTYYSIKYKHICKECLPEEFLDWNSWKMEPTLKTEVFRNYYRQQQINKIEKEINTKIIHISEAKQIYNSEDKHIFNSFIKRGILKVYKIYDIFNSEKTKLPICNNFIKYFIKKEIEDLTYIKQNGLLSIRFVQSVKRNPNAIENRPYIWFANNKQLLFINKTEQKRTCSGCLEYKEFSEFYPKETLPGGTSYECKKCSNERNRKRYGYLDIQEKKKHINNNKLWAKQNKDKVKIYRKTQRQKPAEKLKRAIRRAAKVVIKKAMEIGFKEEQTEKLGLYKTLKRFGCSLSELKKHIESKFWPEMIWDNYGPGFKLDSEGKIIYDERGNIIPLKQWQVDHIIPISSFDLTKLESYKSVNHYTNLQPLWAEDNRLKGDKLDYDIEEMRPDSKDIIEVGNKLKEIQEFYDKDKTM